MIIKDTIHPLNFVGNQNTALTYEEGNWLNSITNTMGINYNFVLKKVAFFHGEGGRVLADKNLFLKQYIDTIQIPHYMGTLYIFDESAKQKVLGYDAAIVFGSKRLDTTKKMIKIIRKKCNK